MVSVMMMFANMPKIDGECDDDACQHLRGIFLFMNFSNHWIQIQLSVIVVPIYKRLHSLEIRESHVIVTGVSHISLGIYSDQRQML
ncbi:hypothetical protein L2E82_48207 [Cichorium intybus]|uniref:Uncharacterized protein n=1 Tax=Cichorium intybus TaxID=13427 RepID=A0ACB8YXN5_CICIN|nr:hypothetical protein L2E82_48207 [Cichorium intybus]